MAPPLEHQVLDVLPVMVYAVDLQGRVTYLNRAWSRFAQQGGAPHLGDDRTVVGASIWDSISDTSAREQIRQAMATLCEGRASSLSLEFSSTSSTDQRNFLLQISAIGDARAVTGYALSTVDVSSSHRAHEVRLETGRALARTISLERVLNEASQQLLRTMLCDTVAIALTNEDGSGLRLAHHSGFASADTEIIAARLGPAWKDVMNSKVGVTRSDDEGIEITVPFTRNNEITGAITVSASSPQKLDETRRVLAGVAEEAAAAIERAFVVQRLEHRRRLDTIGEVTAGVAHELRNPLFGISSAAQLLRFRVKDDPVVEKNIGRILREVERLNSIVTSLLEYGNPAPVSLQPADPDRVWDGVIESNRGRLESKALLLQRIRGTPEATCAIDAQQLAQVFTNLFMNATEAAPEGSDLTLQSARLPNGGWRCQLRNTGPAIPADVLPRVFEIFFSTKPGGIGIGLSLCQRIVDEHHGSITLESTPEAGTAVSVILPPVS